MEIKCAGDSLETSKKQMTGVSTLVLWGFGELITWNKNA